VPPTNPFRPPGTDQDPLGRSTGEFEAHDRERRLRLALAALWSLVAPALGAAGGLVLSVDPAGLLAGTAVGAAVGVWYFWSVYHRTVRLGERGVVIDGNWVPWSDVFHLASQTWGGRFQRTRQVIYIGYSSDNEPRVIPLCEHRRPGLPDWMDVAARKIRTTLSEAEVAALERFGA